MIPTGPVPPIPSEDPAVSVAAPSRLFTIALLLCGPVSAAPTAGARVAMAPQEARAVDDELLEEIEALYANVYDQRMARQFGMGLELPAKEVEARLEVFGRWLEATRRGVFPDSSALPEGLVEEYEETRRALREAGDAPDPEVLDTVLLFLETNTDALQKASGLKIELPM